LASDENDLIGLAPELDPRLHVIALRAPYETGYGGYTWFGIQFFPDGSRSIDEGQALASCNNLVDALASLPTALGFQPSQLFLGGFSQGAMMASGVLLRRPDLLAGAWLMSGRHLPIFDPKGTIEGSKPVLVQHGLYDEVLEVAEGRELAKVLAEQGHAVQYEEYAMGHQISPESLADALRWQEGLLVPEV
jgi:phospholipase/carboxylesterase